MVTKVREIRQATEFASNFEQNPETTSGSTFGFYGGSVVNLSGEAIEISGGSVVVPAGTYYLYVEMASVTPTVNLASTITSGNYSLLYQITNSGGSLSWEDRRSWTAAAIGGDLLSEGGGSSALTGFETEINSLNPIVWYRFNESYEQAQTGLVNWGSLSTAWDLPVILPGANDQYYAQFVQLTGGDQSGTSQAMGMAMFTPNGGGLNGFRKLSLDSSSMSAFTSSGTGTWIIAASWGYDGNSANDTILHFDNSVSVNDAEFEIGMFNDNLEIDFFADTGSIGDWEVQSSTGINQDLIFPTFKLVVIVQPGDGTGPKLYVNGVDAGTYTGVGAGEEDYWFDNWTTNSPNSFTVGGAYSTDTSSTSQFNGILETLAYTTTALSAAEVSALYDVYSGA